MIKILESIDNNKEKEIVINVRDSEGQLSKLLDDIKKTASQGHTFDVVVDPDCEEPRAYEIDGDGSFEIKNINESEVDEKEEKKEESFQPSNELSEALNDMYEAMKNVSKIWNKGMYGINRECLDNSKYPFHKSFDELLLDVVDWIDAARTIELNGGE